ncbi:MAG: hypothetical protein AAGF12_04840 [Myxococcota bacterium]
MEGWVAILDDQARVAAGLARLVRTHFGLPAVITTTPEDLRRLLAHRSSPKAVIIDEDLGDVRGTAVLNELELTCPCAIWSGMDPEEVKRAVEEAELDIPVFEKDPASVLGWLDRILRR